MIELLAAELHEAHPWLPLTTMVNNVITPGCFPASQGQTQVNYWSGSSARATMRSELDKKSSIPHGISLGESDILNTYVNSNFQAVKNFIMFGSSYNTNDPGVHLDISDVSEHEVNQ
ncbi:hypothetical protein F3Y22_tig00110223pilonHSYRG00036 [Hibiscus syriacus]|uniref:Uncharacterized protein n=1 Tax=Hibiscus syriacus TaxID=106335 RepID=A0A6A3B7J2_HIBSY|nr:hypothetical protein F3Y22_tig00110223pilonHSYRG00036 [Hibiscus syriacus]